MRTMLVSAITLALFLIKNFVPDANASNSTKQQQIQKLIESYQLQGTFNGSVLVAQRGEVIYSGGVGFANMEWKVKNTADTKFYLASITKTFTSVTVMKLIDQGKLTLDTKLSDVLKWYRADIGNKVTIRHLLNHTSGIANYLNMKGKSIYQVADDFGTAPIDKLAFAKKYCQGDLEFEPGTQWNYNNTAYFLLGLIIEQVSGNSFENAVSEFIFKPLGMNNSGDIQAHQYDVFPGMATGYMRNFTDFVHPAYWNMSTAYAQGSIYSNVYDLLKFDQALYDPNFLSKSSYDAMFTPKLNNYGCGWEIKELPIGKDKTVKRIRTHEGFLFAWHTRFYQIPDDQYLIVILSNRGSAPLENICSGITDILYDRQSVLMKPLIANFVFDSFKNKSVKSALEQCRGYFLKEKDKWDFNELELNHLGYYALLSDPESSVSIFKFITDIYPQSWNAWDSYGEALAVAGNKAEAIQAYERSVKMNPENKAGFEMLKKLKDE
ncbi:MAG: serine hydrolase [Prolixibacteraceae bacterium]|nr:serine hydrolase [Prolixibacteraceae bacterium]